MCCFLVTFSFALFSLLSHSSLSLFASHRTPKSSSWSASGLNFVLVGCVCMQDETFCCPGLRGVFSGWRGRSGYTNFSLPHLCIHWLDSQKRKRSRGSRPSSPDMRRSLGLCLIPNTRIKRPRTRRLFPSTFPRFVKPILIQCTRLPYCWSALSTSHSPLLVFSCFFVYRVFASLRI